MNLVFKKAIPIDGCGKSKINMGGFSAGIHVLVQKDSKYLVIRRSKADKQDPDCWDLPGGGIDFGEQPFDAAIREAKEEVGINIEIIKTLTFYAMPYLSTWSVESIVEGKYISGDVMLSHEHSEFKWVNEKELREIEPKNIHLKALLKQNKLDKIRL